ncbi:Gfo/Idh/MocA family oxidoreductase [Deinococcus sonorensis]|uniref:Gfo/Idh/MocA family oxidoreductase n=2 Tax=Deinococcus sonorensis TaxID=309891 RepID=A0AAU7U886_9DEIO
MAFTWGILGAARIARALIPAIREAGGEVVMVGCRDQARGEAFAREWDIPQVGRYEDLQHADLDAVYNPLPNDLHLPWSRRMLEAGRHVLTEKPMTLNATEAAELARVAGEQGRVLLEALAYRFAPGAQELVRLVRAGELGEIRQAQGAYGFTLSNPQDFRWHPEQGGGALYDVGVYVLSLMRLLLGEPQAASARAHWSEGGIDLTLSGVLDYGEHGPLASLSCGFEWKHHQSLQLIGSEGTLQMDSPYDNHPKLSRMTVNGEERTIPGANGYALMVQHFQRVAAGEEPALYPPQQDAVAQAQALDALLASAHQGRRVPVGEG